MNAVFSDVFYFERDKISRIETYQMFTNGSARTVRRKEPIRSPVESRTL